MSAKRKRRKPAKPETERDRRERKLEETFPASDAVAVTEPAPKNGSNKKR